MKNLGREKGGQLSVSSHPEIMREFRKAAIDCSQFEFNGEPADQAVVVNAWIYALTRVDRKRMLSFTREAIGELEMWSNGNEDDDPDGLASQLGQALLIHPAASTVNDALREAVQAITGKRRVLRPGDQDDVRPLPRTDGLDLPSQRAAKGDHPTVPKGKRLPRR